jgi:hypothetical protein
MGLADQYLDERFKITMAAHTPLPFFHCCDARFLQSILDTRELRPRFCKVYEEDLLYLFYGKPAYKSGETSNSRLTFMMPICFIVNHDAVTSVKRVLPFDSGAFPMYREHLHGSMTKEEFELTPLKDSLYKMVDYFYEDSNAYFNGKAKQELDYDPIHSQIEGYHSIITADHKTAIDDRKASLEVQLHSSISICNSNIEAIILPKCLAESPSVKPILFSELNIPIIPITNYGVVSKDYYVHVMEKAKQFLIGKKLLNDN